ncbi:MAG: map, partial [Thermoleophilia bacterium]|nr:map [Thermoleophilia bacterium]
MIIRKSRKDIDLMRRSGILLAEVHELLAPLVQVGATTREIDAVAEAHIRKHGGSPTFKGYNGFPATLCMSVNSKVVHGFPDDVPLDDGDLLSI